MKGSLQALVRPARVYWECARKPTTGTAQIRVNVGHIARNLYNNIYGSCGS